MMQTQDNHRNLRLIRPSTIRQNLMPLEQNTKKKLAQTLYYQNHSHASPLIREEKPPVHQRLGFKQMRLKRFVPLGTNTATLLPKRKLFKYSNKVDKFKQNKARRIYSAQTRLERIRLQQRNNGIIKLKRLNGGVPSATNFTVEVKNSNYVHGNNSGGFFKFRMVLDHNIQNEIREIQKDSAGLVAELPPSTRITPVTTLTKISERFSML